MDSADGCPFLLAVASLSAEAACGSGVHMEFAGDVWGGVVLVWVRPGRIAGSGLARLVRALGCRVSLLPPVPARQGLFAIVDGTRHGWCGDGHCRPLSRGPHFHEADGFLYRHRLVGALEEVLLDLCIGEAYAELVSDPLLTLVAHCVAARTLLYEAAYLSLVCLCLCVCVCMCAYMYLHAYACVYVCSFACVCVCNM